jgi:hypothetical protein
VSNSNSNSSRPDNPTKDCSTSANVEANVDMNVATEGPAWVRTISKPDNRAQPWRLHDGIGEDTSFAEGKDMVRMADAEYPGGSLAA